jgi:hypothetical protein
VVCHHPLWPTHKSISQNHTKAPRVGELGHVRQSYRRCICRLFVVQGYPGVFVGAGSTDFLQSTSILRGMHNRYYSNTQFAQVRRIKPRSRLNVSDVLGESRLGPWSCLEISRHLLSENIRCTDKENATDV